MGDVLMVIDMQNDFIRDWGVLSCGKAGEKILAPVQELVRKSVENNVPVIFTGDMHDMDDREFEQFPPHCVKGTKGCEIIDELYPFLECPNVYMIHKTRFSPFYGTKLTELLKELESESGEPLQVTVVGVCTDICVYFTVEGLRNRDYKTIVYRDMVASGDPLGHEVFLGHMEKVLGAQLR